VSPRQETPEAFVPSAEALPAGGRERLLEMVFQQAVRRVLRTEDFDALVAWLRDDVLPSLDPVVPWRNPEERRAAALEMARTVWSSVPLPSQGFRVRPIPRPERNDPCLCGSGRKYKRCCSQARSLVEPVQEGVWLLLALDLPEERLGDFARSGTVPRAALGEIANELLERGDPWRAAALVEPLFERPERLDERDVDSLEALLSAYGELDLHEELDELVERLGRQLPRVLQAALWREMTVRQAQDGDLVEARESFRRLVEVDPDGAVRGPLEVILLLHEERDEEARERAGSLVPTAEEILSDAAADPLRARRKVKLGAPFQAIERVERLLPEACARPVSPYRVETDPEEPGLGRLWTPDSLLFVESDWEDSRPPELEALYSRDDEDDEPEPWEDFDEEGLEDQGGEEEEEEDEEEDEEDEGLDEEGDEGGFEGDEDSADGEEEEGEGGREVWRAYRDEQYGIPESDAWEGSEAEEWLSYLERTPAAFDCLVVLDDLARVVDELLGERSEPVTESAFLQPLVSRGVAIVEASLAENPGVRLPWRFADNRPAVRLLRQHADMASGDELLDRVERVIDLDPDDGTRSLGYLAGLVLMSGRFERALALAEKYGDDAGLELLFAKALALDLLGRREEAFAALDDFVEAYPRAASLLADPEEPDLPEEQLEILELEEELRARTLRAVTLARRERSPELFERLRERAAGE
jgi:tetratricopeptide (TPR) repeat protein